MAKKSDNYRPGAIDVASVRMKNSDQTEVVDLTSLCVFFNIYEDIYNNCMQADFTLIDAQGLFSDFPINGDEVIEVSTKFEDLAGGPSGRNPHVANAGKVVVE